jgi:hypothetical protein
MKIKAGSFLDGHNNPGWGLETPNGIAGPLVPGGGNVPNLRTFTKTITFTGVVFTKKPQVVVGMNFLDATSGGGPNNVRVSATAENITSSSFDLVIRTWDASLVYGLGVQWIAIED